MGNGMALVWRRTNLPQPDKVSSFEFGLKLFTNRSDFEREPKAIVVTFAKPVMSCDIGWKRGR